MFIILDWFFILFHTLLILFNLFGWIIKQWRIWNLLTLLSTAFSWFGLGIFYGWGYCLCTDWHWKVRDALHYETSSDSYIQFLALQLTGFRFEEEFVNNVTASVFLISLTMSILLNLKFLKSKFV